MKPGAWIRLLSSRTTILKIISICEIIQPSAHSSPQPIVKGFTCSEWILDPADTLPAALKVPLYRLSTEALFFSAQSLQEQVHLHQWKAFISFRALNCCIRFLLLVHVEESTQRLKFASTTG